MKIMTSEVRRFLLIFLFVSVAWCQCGSDCLDCQSSMGVCAVCSGNLETDVFGKCHANTVQKCVTYGPTGDCLRCQSTYSLQNKSCIKDYSGCTSSGSQNQCYQCGFGRSLQNLTCKGVINCATYQQNCTRCSDGYQLTNNICRDTSSGCAEVRSTDGLCAKCNDGYFLSGFKCYQNSYKNERCYILFSNQICLFCKSGFNQVNGKCVLFSETQSPSSASSTSSNFGVTSSDFGFGSSGSSQTSTTTSSSSSSSSFSSSAGLTSINSPVNTNIPLTTTTTTTSAPTTTTSAPIATTSFSGTGSTVQTSSGSSSFSSGSSGSFGDFNSGNSGFTSGGTVSTQSIPNCEVPNPSGGCIICVYGYFPQNNACIPVSILCDGHNVQTGDCFACKFSLSLQNGKCIDTHCTSTLNNVCQQCNVNYRANQNGVCTLYDPNCRTTQNGRCQQCTTGYYIQMTGTCKALPLNCNIANIQTGDCLQCSQGYKIQRAGSPCVRQLPNNCQSANSANQCVVCNNGYETNQGQCIERINIANCNVVDSVNRRCVTCADRYYPQQNACASVSATCNTYNPTNGLCTTCRTGNTLQANGSCTTTPVVIPVITPTIPTTTTTVPGTSQTIPTSTQVSDANCRTYNGAICITCSNRYYVGTEGKCIPVNPLCRQNNPQGDCTSCYPGYAIQSGRCIIGQASDPNCKTLGSQGCNECYAGFYVNSADRICKRVNPLCRTSNPNTGACLSCYPGYGINTSTGNCEISFKDPNCKQFKADNTCAQCAVRFYIGASGSCLSVNPLCKQYSLVTGACTTCYPGYRASNNTCVVGSSNDVNCRTFQGSMCTACFSGFFISTDGSCKQISPLCRTFSNTTGACTSCYQGYELSGQNCVEATSRDQNCKTFSSSNSNSCIQCYPGFIAISGSCRNQNPLCRTINSTTGACTSCWQGYIVSGQNCIVEQQSSQSSPSGTTDAYCIKFTNSVCTQCSNGFYYSSREMLCKQMDPLCRTSDNTTGSCLSCYPGYSLTNSKCEIAQIAQIPNCNLVSSSGACVECFSGYYISNNSCQPVSILCATYSQQTGQCLSCISQHFLQDGVCIYPGIFDSHCIRYQNSFCSQCQQSYYLSSYTCQAVDPNCSSFNYSTNTCQACYNGRIPQGVACL